MKKTLFIIRHPQAEKIPDEIKNSYFYPTMNFYRMLTKKGETQLLSLCMYFSEIFSQGNTVKIISSPSVRTRSVASILAIILKLQKCNTSVSYEKDFWNTLELKDLSITNFISKYFNKINDGEVGILIMHDPLINAIALYFNSTYSINLGEGFELVMEDDNYYINNFIKNFQ